MPFMQRLTMSGVALHSGVVTGRPASHGCIRLPHAYATRLFGLTKLGIRVIVADEEVTPVSIVHRRLFTPKHPQVATTSGLGATFPETVPAGSGPGGHRRLRRRRAAARAVARAKVGEASADREEEPQALPVSVFVSRATGRVYVRHGFLPLFDAPAEIRDGERSIGTHVYTAMDAEDEGARLRWNVRCRSRRSPATPARPRRSTASSCRPTSSSASRTC